METDRRPCRRPGGGDAGQATVEFALVLPVIILLSLVVVQAATVAHDLVLVHHAAREAARSGAVEPRAAVVRQAAVASGGLDPSRMSVHWSGGSQGPRGQATVHYRSPTNVPLVGVLVGDIELSAAVTVRIE